MVFDYGDIEEFQQYFSLLDIDNSGDLSTKEVRLLLKAMDIHINELKLAKLLKTVDLNGNGTIEFDEFCWMV
jgi:Ca2+-binding EF-hand superfamily protein